MRDREADSDVNEILARQNKGARPSVLDGDGFSGTMIEFRTDDLTGRLVPVEDESTEIVYNRPKPSGSTTTAPAATPNIETFQAAVAADASSVVATKSVPVQVNYIWARVQDSVLNFRKGNEERAQTVFEAALKDSRALKTSPLMKESPAYKGYLDDLFVIAESGNKKESLILTAARYEDGKVPKFSEYTPSPRTTAQTPTEPQGHEPLL